MNQNIKTILKRFNDHGYDAYLVGGAVRSFLLKEPIKDYDITTSADPNAIKLLFQDYKTYDVGKKHGTVTLLIDTLKVDITPFRSEKDYFDHRHPNTVEFTTSLIEDVKRRDFTINALCMDKDEKIIDYFNGIEDLNNHIIRAIGNPDTRFNEDALRILRALRFKAKLNFTIEEETKNALFKNKDLLKVISKERIKDEFLQILSYPSAYELINEYLEIFQTFIDIDKVDRKNDFSNCFYSLAYLIKDRNIHLKELKYSGNEIQLLHCLIDASKIDMKDDYSFIKALSNIYQENTLTYLEELYHIDLKKRYESLRKYMVTLNDLKITGQVLEQAGYQGKEISIAKNKLLEMIYHQEIENNEGSLQKVIHENRI